MSEDNQPLITQIRNLQNEIRDKEDELKDTYTNMDILIKPYNDLIKNFNSSKSSMESDINTYLLHVNKIAMQDRNYLLLKNQNLENSREIKEKEIHLLENEKKDNQNEISKLHEIRTNIDKQTVGFNLHEELNGDAYKMDILDADDKIIAITEIIQKLVAMNKKLDDEILRCQVIISDYKRQQTDNRITLKSVEESDLITDDGNTLKSLSLRLNNIQYKNLNIDDEFDIIDIEAEKNNFNEIYNEADNCLLQIINKITLVEKSVFDNVKYYSYLKIEAVKLKSKISIIYERLANKLIVSINQQGIVDQHQLILSIKAEIKSKKILLQNAIGSYNKKTIRKYKCKQLNNIRQQYVPIGIFIFFLLLIIYGFHTDLIIDSIKDVCCSDDYCCNIACLFQIIITTLSLFGLILSISMCFKISNLGLYIKAKCEDLEVSTSIDAINGSISLDSSFQDIKDAVDDITIEITKRNKNCFWNCSYKND